MAPSVSISWTMFFLKTSYLSPSFILADLATKTTLHLAFHTYRKRIIPNYRDQGSKDQSCKLSPINLWLYHYSSKALIYLCSIETLGYFSSQVKLAVVKVLLFLRAGINYGHHLTGFLQATLSNNNFITKTTFLLFEREKP